MRRLALHASALSDSEYELFTNSLHEIADDDSTSVDDDKSHAFDDAHFERISVGVREARAWLRGRYSHIPPPGLDSVLRLFSPNLGHTDTMTGPEFFAALRLVIHLESGKELDRSLVFVQVDPSAAPRSHVSRSSNDSRSSSPAKSVPHFSSPRRPFTDSSIALSPGSSITTDAPSHNPFYIDTDSLQHTYHPQPPLHPSQRSETSRSIVSVSQHSVFNPFVQRPPRSEDGTLSKTIPPLPPRKASTMSVSHHSAGPPPPPRPSATRSGRLERSLSPTKESKGLNSAPPIPPKPSHHVTSTLMKQSLQASKVAQTMKKAEEQLEKERVMQVLKSSSVVSGTNIHNQHQHQYPHNPRQSSPSASGRKYVGVGSVSSSSEGGSGHYQPHHAPPLPKRRSTQGPQPSQQPPSQQPSPPLSASSLEQVALAAPPPQHHQRERAEHQVNDSPFKSAADPGASTDHASDHSMSVPPPMHPDRKSHLGYHQLPPSFGSSPSSSSQRHPNLETFESIYGTSSLPQGSPSPSNLGDTVITHAFKSSTASSASHSAAGPNPDSPTARVFRSKSLHQTTAFTPPVPPPPRRRRPESFQVVSSPAFDDTDSGSASLSRHTSLTAASTPGHRKSSLSISSIPSFMNQKQSSSSVAVHASSSSSSSTGPPSGMGTNIQRTIDALHSIHGQLQPKLDKARYKAEAGISRRGYMRGAGHGSGESSSDRAEEREGLTGYGGTRRMRGNRLLSDGESRGERSSGRSGEDTAEVDYGYGYEEDIQNDDEWTRGRRDPTSVEIDGSVFPDQRGHHRPRNVFDDSPEREEDDTRSGPRRWTSDEGWKPL